jgi:hypothetical protein
MSESSQACPICDTKSTFEVVHQPYGKLFTCPNCTEFFIDVSSEKYLGHLPEVTRTDTRRKLQQNARACGPENVFVIRAPRNDELGGDGRGIAQTTMIAECITREG